MQSVLEALAVLEQNPQVPARLPGVLGHVERVVVVPAAAAHLHKVTKNEKPAEPSAHFDFSIDISMEISMALGAALFAERETLP